MVFKRRQKATARTARGGGGESRGYCAQWGRQLRSSVTRENKSKTPRIEGTTRIWSADCGFSPGEVDVLRHRAKRLGARRRRIRRETWERTRLLTNCVWWITRRRMCADPLLTPRTVAEVWSGEEGFKVVTAGIKAANKKISVLLLVFSRGRREDLRTCRSIKQFKKRFCRFHTSFQSRMVNMSKKANSHDWEKLWFMFVHVIVKTRGFFALKIHPAKPKTSTSLRSPGFFFLFLPSSI